MRQSWAMCTHSTKLRHHTKPDVAWRPTLLVLLSSSLVSVSAQPAQPAQPAHSASQPSQPIQPASQPERAESYKHACLQMSDLAMRPDPAVRFGDTTVAAESGFIPAWQALGTLYFEGRGTFPLAICLLHSAVCAALRSPSARARACGCVLTPTCVYACVDLVGLEPDEAKAVDCWRCDAPALMQADSSCDAAALVLALTLALSAALSGGVAVYAGKRPTEVLRAPSTTWR
jgi:hypothetical protein